ncbi:MAG: hypothetical protein QOD75_1295 [Blastocatellia bacterium]|nr:hypothetical protein [Blastocatellia bacterium]
MPHGFSVSHTGELRRFRPARVDVHLLFERGGCGRLNPGFPCTRATCLPSVVSWLFEPDAINDRGTFVKSWVRDQVAPPTGVSSSCRSIPPKVEVTAKRKPKVLAPGAQLAGRMARVPSASAARSSGRQNGPMPRNNGHQGSCR